ncbi:L,D-transpeptidase [Paenibacillus wynnii]|uniref:L,D-transpeptidase n=1 Tax=Paenibacillus wynnii TaxID=268407 RepID=UPI002794ECA1|nr:L,D-transpeptidase [Paenibacillus wynnii]MDQ0195895.1 lipoprotein-anchoring transpeptidase ErfK/SrfK [Paenibacillus wynnii]
MKNSQHLKAYVQMHPDNKMAWYLLGKEYYKNGQEGKANYCFNEAGEVYEAFEHSKVPGEVLREYEEGLMRADQQRQLSKLKVRRWLLGLMFLLLLIMPSYVSPGIYIDKETGKRQVNNLAGDTGPTPNEVTIEAEAAEILFTAEEVNGVTSGKAFMNILQNKKTPARIAVLGLERSGKWLLWKEKLPLKFTVAKTGNGQAAYQDYDPVACSCQPPEHGELTAKAAQWQEQQVEKAALWSSIRAFANSKGRSPASLKELASPFPGNWLAGTTPAMKVSFMTLMKAAAETITPTLPAIPDKQLSPAGASGGTAATPSAAISEAGMPFLSEPLTIIVDKQKHRLAVTSGSIILRNYEVGLGGNKTPEGSFVISDKVVNPNGHDNGEFGSRGLQLSDSNYAIHGTNEPESVGKDESLGCIRMKREDVEELFALVPRGTKVQISKGVLPAELLIPEDRFSPSATQNQTNPHKVYHWLN